MATTTVPFSPLSLQQRADIAASPAGVRRATALAMAVRIVEVIALFIVTRLERLDDALERRRNARALEALPMDLRKDLGWPSGDMR